MSNHKTFDSLGPIATVHRLLLFPFILWYTTNAPSFPVANYSHSVFPQSFDLNTALTQNRIANRTIDANVLSEEHVELITNYWASEGQSIHTTPRSTPTLPLTVEERPSPCTKFDQCFGRLPTELQSMIIDFALSHGLTKPRTVTISTGDALRTTVRTPPLVPLFHISTFFRYEALKISQRRTCLAPLASHRSTKLGENVSQHFQPRITSIIARFARLGAFLSKTSLIPRYPGPHLFNAETCQLELDLTRSYLWFNAFLRVSPAICGRVKYPKIVTKGDGWCPHVPLVYHGSFRADIGLLPSVMPNLELLILKRDKLVVRSEWIDVRHGQVGRTGRAWAFG
jgi:hypothetical protein